MLEEARKPDSGIDVAKVSMGLDAWGESKMAAVRQQKYRTKLAKDKKKLEQSPLYMNR